MTDFKWQRGDFQEVTISAMKRYVLTYLTWKEEGQDVNGKRITPAITAKYEFICDLLKEIGEKCP